MSYQTDPEECKRIQVRECMRLLNQGHTDDYLRGAGYAEGAIIEAEKQRNMEWLGKMRQEEKQEEQPDPPLPEFVSYADGAYIRVDK